MSKTALPRFSELMPHVLAALKDLGGSGSVSELNDWVSSHLDLSEEQLEETYEKSGDFIFRDRMSWARSYLKSGGLVENSRRGVWAITPEGRRAKAEDVAAIPRAVVAEYNRQKAGDPVELEAPTGDERDWKEILLEKLKVMDPSAFERLCQRVLREKGFTKVEVTGRTGDGGIDGQGVLRVNLLSFQVIFQSKRWKDSVGAPVIRDFRGAMIGRADKGLIMTTGRFTTDARAEATRDGAPAIDLVDGDDFCELLKEIELGVRVRLVEAVTLSTDELDDV